MSVEDVNFFGRPTKGKGNQTLRMLSLPTPSNPGVFLTDEQEKLAKKAETGNKKALAKLKKENISYYKTEIEYNVTVKNSPNTALGSALNNINANPHRNGVIVDPIPAGAYSSSNFNSDFSTNVVNANLEFRQPTSTGNPAEGYGSIFSITGSEINVVVFNPGSGNMLSDNDVIVHEVGHNMTNQAHGTIANDYEYTEKGLQSASKNGIYPSSENTRRIINDASNRSTIKTKDNTKKKP